jgi:hypothetical protein
MDRPAAHRAVRARPGHGALANRKAKSMQKFLLSLTLVALTPLTALAMPVVGDIIGSDPETAKAALEKAGCLVDEFEAEDGKIEAKCKDTATGADMEVYLDPATGAVVDIKAED